MLETIVYLAALFSLVLSMINMWLAAKSEEATIQCLLEIKAKLAWCEKQINHPQLAGYDYEQEGKD